MQTHLDREGASDLVVELIIKSAAVVRTEETTAAAAGQFYSGNYFGGFGGTSAAAAAAASLSASPSYSIFVEAVLLGVALLEGGNPVVQRSLYNKLLSPLAPGTAAAAAAAASAGGGAAGGGGGRGGGGAGAGLDSVNCCQLFFRVFYDKMRDAQNEIKSTVIVSVNTVATTAAAQAAAAQQQREAEAAAAAAGGGRRRMPPLAGMDSSTGQPAHHRFGSRSSRKRGKYSEAMHFFP